MVQIDDHVFLPVANHDEKAPLLLLRHVSMLQTSATLGQRTCAPFRINAGMRESIAFFGMLAAATAQLWHRGSHANRLSGRGREGTQAAFLRVSPRDRVLLSGGSESAGRELEFAMPATFSATASALTLRQLSANHPGRLHLSRNSDAEDIHVFL